MKRILFVSFALVTIAILAIIANASKPYFQEKQRPLEAPSNVVWNSDLGEYYNGDSFTWNSEKNKYEIVGKNYILVQTLVSSFKSTDDFIAETSDTSDEVDKAVAKYYKKVKEIALSGVTEGNAGPQSFYNPNTDTALYELKSIGIKNIPLMVKKVKNKHIASSQLMYAINEMMQVKDIDTYVSAEPEAWLSHVKGKITEVGPKVKEASRKLKNNANNENKKQAKEDLKNYGLFSLPYISDEVNAGNTEMIDLLPNANDSYNIQVIKSVIEEIQQK